MGEFVYGLQRTGLEFRVVAMDAGADEFQLRRILNPMGVMDAIEFLIDKLKSTKNNDEFFDSMNT